MLAPSSPPQSFGVPTHNTHPSSLPYAPHLVKLHSNSILNSTSSFNAISLSPPLPAAENRNTSRLGATPLRSGAVCSFADPTRAGTSLVGDPRPKLADVAASSGSSLLQRRRSSASAAARPNMNLALPPVPALPTDEVREHIIGISAAADAISSPSSEPDTPTGHVCSIVERAFQQVKSRRPTPFPEKAVFLGDSDEEEAGDDAEAVEDGNIEVRVEQP